MPNDQTLTESFTRFARDNEPRLRRALTAGFGSEIGREAAAEALVYGWQKWLKLRAMDNPAGYLYRVGQSKARRMSPRRSWSGREEVTYSEPWAEPHLGQAWSELSERERVVTGLVHGFDWSLAEVAELIGISKSTARSYEQRGLKKLRDHLGVKS